MADVKTEAPPVELLQQFSKGLGGIGTGIVAPGASNPVEEVKPKVEETKVETTEEVKVEPKVEEQKVEEQKVEDEQETSDETVIDALKKKLPFDLKDENGNDLVFENDFDSIVAFTETVGKEYAKREREAFLDSNPDVKALITHLNNGGTVDTFVKQTIPDYSKIEVSKDNIEQQKGIYKQALKLKGLSDSDIEDLVEVAVSKGVILDKAINAKGDLVKFREDSLKEEQTKFEARNKEIQQEAENTLKEVKETLSKGKILGIEISKQDQDVTLNYLTKPVKDGLTQYQIDEQNETMEQSLFHAYLRLKKYNGILPKVADKVTKAVSNSLPTRNNPAIIKSSESGVINNKPVVPSISDRDAILGKRK